MMSNQTPATMTRQQRYREKCLGKGRQQFEEKKRTILESDIKIYFKKTNKKIK